MSETDLSMFRAICRRFNRPLRVSQ